MTTETLNKTKKTGLFRIDPRAVQFNKDDNPRKFYGTPSEWKEFKNSIVENGVQEPIKILNVNGVINLVHGFRRMTAVMELIAEGTEIQYINAIPAERGYSEEQSLLDHIILNSGRPLTPMEEANVYQGLINFGWTQSQIAKKVGKTQGSISQTLLLVNIPMKLQNHINTGLITSSLVMKIIKENKFDYTKVISIIDDAIGKMTITNKKKVTEKTISGKKVPKYISLLNDAIDIMKKDSISAKKIAQVESIMKAMELKQPEELAKQLVEIL